MSSKNTKTKRTFKTGIVNMVALSFVVISMFFITDFFQEFSKASQTKKELVEIKYEIKMIETEKQDLEDLKAKLADSNYVQNYARGKHLMSKSEEQVFILPKAKE